MIQPIVARPVKGATDRYEIIAGERRWRAAQIAGLHEVPIVPVDVSDSDALQIAIIENVQREDLNAMEEAHGYQALANEFNHSAGRHRKDRGKKPQPCRQHDPADEIAQGSADADRIGKIVGRPRACADRRARSRGATARLIIEKGLNVRQVEGLVYDIGGSTRKPRNARGALVKDPDTLALEKRVGDILGLSVSVDHRGPDGTMHIKYRDLEQLDEILRRLDTKV